MKRIPSFDIASKCGVLITVLPLNPVSPYPKSSAIRNMMLGRWGASSATAGALTEMAAIAKHPARRGRYLRFMMLTIITVCRTLKACHPLLGAPLRFRFRFHFIISLRLRNGVGLISNRAYIDAPGP